MSVSACVFVSGCSLLSLVGAAFLMLAIVGLI